MTISAAKFLALRQWNDLSPHYVLIVALNVLFFCNKVFSRGMTP